MRPDEIKRLYLHCEIVIPTGNTLKFKVGDTHHNVHPVHSEAAHHVAFLASQIAVKKYIAGTLTPPF